MYARLLLAAIATGLALVVAIAGLQRAGIDLEWRLWLLERQLFGPEPVGIWREDPRFGWVHDPGSQGRDRVPNDFDVTYRIDRHGHRATSGSYELPKILFLGGSFTFGHGVEDDEPYPALLGERLRGYKAVNAAVNAWGTAHAYLALEAELSRWDDVRAAVYGFIRHHRFRSYVRKPWLDEIARWRGRRNPHFELEDGRLVHRGLADPARDGLPPGERLARREWAVTLRLLEEMKRLCDERGVPFLLVRLPDGRHDELLEPIARTLGADAIRDLRDTVDYASIRFRHDRHPTAEGHRRIADAIQPTLERLLLESRAR